MWREIKASSLLFKYDNEDGSPISEKQIKQIREIEKKLLEQKFELEMSKDNFHKRIFSPEIMVSDLINEIKKIGNVRLIIDKDYYTDEESISTTSCHLFVYK